MRNTVYSAVPWWYSIWKHTFCFPIELFLLSTFHQAFAAGADIKEMQHRDFASNYRENFLEWWSNITLIRWTKYNRDSWSKRDVVTGNFRKPIIAAVNGYALGGGCEVSCLPFSSRVQNVVPLCFFIKGSDCFTPLLFHQGFRMFYPIIFSSRVQNVVPHCCFIKGSECCSPLHCFSVLGITFWRVEVFIEGGMIKRKTKIKDCGS